MVLETRGVNKEDGISDQRGPAGHGWSFLGILLFGMLGLTETLWWEKMKKRKPDHDHQSGLNLRFLAISIHGQRPE